MTGRIQVLPEQVKNMIAAGEVVERPASVVKELIENAIDAGAGAVDVTIQGGGRVLIAVADDGFGMTGEDAALALARHATSKIRRISDLAEIETLGFRGEALPAIAAVSDFKLITRPATDTAATSIHVRHGGRPEIREDARAKGTSVEVRNLFAKTPARAKFLKTRATEIRWIIQVFSAYALAYPQIAFSLTVDGRRQAYFGPTQNRVGRIQEVLGTSIRWIPISPQDGRSTLTGLISEPEMGRSATNLVYFFVNRRWVASRSMMRSLLQAYAPFLPKGRFPGAVIYAEIPPDLIDVNVHPTKREVRFREERKVCADLRDLVETHLRVFRKGRLQAGPVQTPGGSRISEGRPRYEVATTAQQLETGIEVLGGQAELESPSAEAGAPRFVATLAKTYLVAQDGDDLVLIDLHAAHERILYEEAERSLRSQRAASQALLLPLTLELTPAEMQILEEYTDELGRLGYDVGPFGGSSIIIETIPAGLRRWENGQVLKDILAEIAGSTPSETGDRISHVAASYACHAAVRAGDSLSPEEQAGLIARLFACKDWHCCPHGRPTIIRIDRSEIQRRFRRP